MIDIDTYVTLAKDNIDIAEQYRISNSSTKLFKFVPFYDSGNPDVNKRNIETIEENKLWAAKHTTLNDPFEFKSIYLDEEKIKNSGNSVEDFEGYLKIINDRFLVVSFSVEGDIHPLNNMPLWGYYGNSHHEICIEYEVTDPVLLHPISYEKKRNKIASFIGQYIYLSSLTYNGQISPDDKTLQSYIFLLVKSLCIKHKSWEHENEYRILFLNTEEITNGKRVPLDDIGVKIKAIYLGKKCSTRNKNKLYQTSQKLGINIFQMDVKNKSNDFIMVYEPYKS